MKRFFYIMVAALLLPALAGAQKPSAGHSDLSGLWQFSIGLPSTALKKEVNGKVEINRIDQSARRSVKSDVAGALPSAPAPSYKPEFQEKVKHLEMNESKLDPVFYCDRPGTPRIGPPRRNRKDANPSYYGDSVGHWEGNTLIVESTNFVDNTWFGEEGYLHSDAMRVTERFWRVGENLAYQATVDDPKVLTVPWTMAARVLRPSNEPLEESPRCVETDGPKLLNSDHHGQR